MVHCDAHFALPVYYVVTGDSLRQTLGVGKLSSLIRGPLTAFFTVM